MRKIIRIAIFVLVAIGLAAVVRRTLAIGGLIGSAPNRVANSSNFAAAAAADAGFARHGTIMLLHILPAALFLLLGSLQFLPGIRTKHPKFHRRSGRVVIVCGYIIGLSALVLPFVLPPVGGLNEAAATTFYALFFLTALTMAWRQALKKAFSLHREWMIRAYNIGLATATIRPIVALFFFFSGLPPNVFFGTAFWIGFTLHLVLAEVWINYTRPKFVPYEN